MISAPKFDTWYPKQDQTFVDVMDWLSSEQRFLCLEAPTGSGKSLISMLAAGVSGKRTVILTATKGLQTQLQGDFGHLFKDVRGQNAYKCRRDTDRTVDQGVCHIGGKCMFRQVGCYYYDAVEEARKADIVVTNYAYWLAQENYAAGLGDVGLLICDEAHLAFKALESFLTFDLTDSDVGKYGFKLPRTEFTVDKYKDQQIPWREWAWPVYLAVRQEIESLQEQRDIMKSAPETFNFTEFQEVGRRLRESTSLANKLYRLHADGTIWTWENRGNGVSFTPLWPAAHASILYGEVPKVMLMSAVFTPKSADIIGVNESRRTLVAQSYFPARNTPITHIPTTRVNYRSTPEDMQTWVDRIDQIIDGRLDRKGLMFTVSYPRRDFLIRNSRHANIMQTHETRNVNEAVTKFRASPAPAIFVSPSVTSGWDFPLDDCRYIIIGKIPYPDTRPNVVKARHKSDSAWTSFTAMETIVQEAGRGTRSHRDTCEVLIIDDNWRWFWGRYREFAPQFFSDRVVGSRPTIPPALEVPRVA